MVGIDIIKDELINRTARFCSRLLLTNQLQSCASKPSTSTRLKIIVKQKYDASPCGILPHAESMRSKKNVAWVQIAVATLSGNSLGQTVHTHCASVH